ncbi:MAG: hypothetical protein ABH885_04775 [Candidatus Omnitrophota bacterium]
MSVSLSDGMESRENMGAKAFRIFLAIVFLSSLLPDTVSSRISEPQNLYKTDTLAAYSTFEQEGFERPLKAFLQLIVASFEGQQLQNVRMRNIREIAKGIIADVNLEGTVEGNALIVPCTVRVEGEAPHFINARIDLADPRNIRFSVEKGLNGGGAFDVRVSAKAQDTYNRRTRPNADNMTVQIAPDVPSAGKAFAVEIIKGMQHAFSKFAAEGRHDEEIVIQLCTGDSPFIGYRFIGGDNVLSRRGLYKPTAGTEVRALLDTWDTPATQDFLVKNGINPALKPDMKKVRVFAVDAMFPERPDDYFAFANLLGNICDLWGISNDERHRNLFRGDIYVTRENGRWRVEEIPEEQYRPIVADIEANGMRFLEYQAACTLEGTAEGFRDDARLRVEGGKVFATVLKEKPKAGIILKRK